MKKPKKPKKPQSAETAGTQEAKAREEEGVKVLKTLLARTRTLKSRAPKNIPDETIARAIVETGGKIGPAAKALGIEPRSLRQRVGPHAKDPSMRGLSQKARSEFRALLKRNVRELLENRNERITIEMMHTKLGRELGFAPDVQKVELSGKVDGDVRLGLLDERAAARRLAQLTEGK